MGIRVRVTSANSALQLLVAGVDDERRVVVPHEVGDLDEAKQLALIHLLHRLRNARCDK
jgi:hypothetical protein